MESIFPYFTHILAFLAAFHVQHIYGAYFRTPKGRLCFYNIAYIFNVLTLIVNLLFFFNYTQAGFGREWEIPLQWVMYHGFNGILLFGTHILIAFEMRKKTGVAFWSG